MNNLSDKSKEELLQTIEEMEAQFNSMVRPLVNYGELCRCILHTNEIIDKAKGNISEDNLKEIITAMKHAKNRIINEKENDKHFFDANKFNDE